jgi:hypothetical protein
VFGALPTKSGERSPHSTVVGCGFLGFLAYRRVRDAGAWGAASVVAEGGASGNVVLGRAWGRNGREGGRRKAEGGKKLGHDRHETTRKLN